MSCNKVIEVKDLSKRYEIYKYPYHRLFQTLSMGHLKLYKTKRMWYNEFATQLYNSLHVCIFLFR